MTTLLGRLSFRDNMQPSEVTDEVRSELARRELSGLFWRLALTALLAVCLWWATWFGYGFGDPKPSWSLEHEYRLESLVVALIAAVIVAFTLRRLRFIRRSSVTKGVVFDVAIRSLYGNSGGSHTAQVFYRFLPTELRDAPDSELLSSSTPHFEGKAKLSAQPGSFGADLEPSSLISVLYDPEQPTRSLVVPLKTEREQQPDASPTRGSPGS